MSETTPPTKRAFADGILPLDDDRAAVHAALDRILDGEARDASGLLDWAGFHDAVANYGRSRA